MQILVLPSCQNALFCLNCFITRKKKKCFIFLNTSQFCKIFQFNIEPYLLFKLRLKIVQKKLYFDKLHIYPCWRKYHYYLRLIGDPSKIDMPDRRPRHASSETDIPHRRLTCLIGNPSGTDMPVESNRNFNTYVYLNSLFVIHFLLIYSLKNYWSVIIIIIYIGACRFQMGLR